MIRLRICFGVLLVAALIDSEVYRWQKRWKRYANRTCRRSVIGPELGQG